ncbi:hypothetical protein GQ53DRAFT_744932 [Thozetella sp. PMI_491]|nr:hypothetical protein GQ53DRAFT_744932 [Thozetella sp. PMI_491]
MQSFYPKAREGRFKPSHPVMAKVRRQMIGPLIKNFLLLQVLFLALFCWVFGVLYQQDTHTHNLTIGFVDYDGGAIGQAFRAAYTRLQRDTFPVVAEYSAAGYAAAEDIDAAVCRTDFWAGIHIMPGASDRLRAALTGTSPAAAYNGSDVISYTWNEARYPTVADSAIAGSISTLSATAKIAYFALNGTLGTLNATDPAVLSLMLNPWQLNSFNIQATTQGSRAIYNTLVIVLILIQEFFYLGTLNGIYGNLKIWTKAKPVPIILIRFSNSAIYTLIGALCSTGAIWAFRSGWDVNGVQFVLNWLTLWLFAHLNFQVLDSFATWLPLPYVPMALISWVMLNVASIMLPFELSPAFFKIGYLFPSHAVYQVLVDIWSRGCNPVLDYALTTLFAWELVATIVTALGVYRKCHYAKLAEEHEEEQVKARIVAAVEFEKERENEMREKPRKKSTATGAGDDNELTVDSSQGEGEAEEEEMRTGLAKVISDVNTKFRRDNMRRRASAVTNLGPSFPLPFKCDDDDSTSTESPDAA